ncbi:MAG: response regulator transcription factor [Lachnospiraceae bacterium]|nr:response regulator transcription factor [Lachnospiraceae bacterium]
MTNVLIVDDERIVQELFTYYIEKTEGRYALVGAIKDADNAEIYCASGKVDLIVMDICTANEHSGITAAKRIKSKYPNIKIIIVTSAPDYRFIDKAKEVGADSFWYKEFSDEELIDVMDKTMQGEKIYPDSTPDVQIGNISSEMFTPKELEVLTYLVQNMGLHEIADKMGIAYTTVRSHIKNLKEKTGESNLIGLCYLVTKNRLILPEY